MKEKADNTLETSRGQISRREGLELTAASIMASLLPVPALAETQSEAPQEGDSMTDTTAIRPFQVSFSDAELDDLKKRINATRWPDREQVPDTNSGRAARHHAAACGVLDDAA